MRKDGGVVAALTDGAGTMEVGAPDTAGDVELNAIVDDVPEVGGWWMYRKF